MKLIELTPEEFDLFASTHTLGNFHQSSSWGELKEKNNWQNYLIGLVDDKNNIYAATLLLAKSTPIRKKMFYSPRGFLIDYHNLEILKEFTIKIKEFIKQHNGFFLKIDPYLIYKERDIDGNIMKHGINNENVLKSLKELKYKHQGFHLYQNDLQPRWMFTTRTKNRAIEDIKKEMDPKTRQVLNRNERLGMTVREINENELEKFKQIMEHTSTRREFIDRPFSYYKNMWDILSKKEMIKIMVAELDTKKIIDGMNLEIISLEKEKEERAYKKENGINKMNEDKFIAKQEETIKNIDRINKKIEDMKILQNKHGNIITLGGILFLIHNNEVLSLVGGSYEEFMEFNSAYSVHFAGLKYAVDHGYKRYNFYGITGDFKEENPFYGLYLFKRGFSGTVEELIGEFDLIINPLFYFLYRVSFSIYHKLKKIKLQIKKK